ncbi:reverse transcriptase domain-containing protein [Tanacetum coccineum]
MLKGCIQKKDFRWSTEAEASFQELKSHLKSLPALTTSRPEETLTLYLAAANEAISTVLLTKIGGIQKPIYFISRTLQGPELNYPSLEKVALALVHAARRLRRYFQAHKICVLTDQPIRQVLLKPENSGRLAKWVIELGEHEIIYKPRSAIKGQILADFIAKSPRTEEQIETNEGKDSGQPASNVSPGWTLFTDETSSTEGFGAGLVLTDPDRQEITYALRFNFKTSNNEAEYEALIAGLELAIHMEAQHLQVFNDQTEARKIRIKAPQYTIKEGILYQKGYLTPWLRCVDPEEADYVLREVHFGSWPFPEAPGMVKFLVVAIDYFTKWVEVEPLATITGQRILRFVWRNIVCGFGIPGIIISDNGKQFANNPFKEWCEELKIKQHFTSVAHPQSNGQTEVTNRTLVQGLKTRLGKAKGNWIEELPNVLWSYRMTAYTRNGCTPFSLVYRSKAVLLTEIGLPIYRIKTFDPLTNDANICLNLELLEERREMAALHATKYKTSTERYYNRRVKHKVLKVGDFVLR